MSTGLLDLRVSRPAFQERLVINRERWEFDGCRYRNSTQQKVPRIGYLSTGDPAKQIGLTIAPIVLMRADKVIK